jgi:ribonuclease D
MASAPLIDTPAALASLASALSSETELALDTEFMRERTYYPRLCLVQLATDRDIFCVDPLAIDELAPLDELLARVDTVLHAARQDIETWLTRCKRIPASIFDTQVAAGLLGLPPQVGYGDLVEKKLGVQLDKAHARTDWAARPLSAEQMLYAAEDVQYLLPLREVLHGELHRLGRIDWFAHEMRRISERALYRTEPAEAWQRLKGMESLDPRRAEVARALAEWRERRAMQRDRPRGWILADDALYDIARALPARREALERIPSLPRGLIENCADDILAAVARSAHLGEKPLATKRRERPSAEHEQRLKALAAIVRRVADEVGLSPEVLATRRDLVNIMNGRHDVEPLKGWRRAVIGEALLAAL